jgi:Na+/H+ antiporter NhaD/arsenite permease-like protein
LVPSLVIVFFIGYLLIIFEHQVQINKTASALCTGIICWVILSVGGTCVETDYVSITKESHSLLDSLSHHVSGISEILFFLLGAMTIVEVIDTHNGFRIITKRINASNLISLIWVVCGLSFFLSAVLDNLTTTIVMVSLCRKLVSQVKPRLYLAALIVIAANAGGAWSPIGDVTTTMLWVKGNVSTQNLIFKLFIPSLVNILVPLFLVSAFLKNEKIEPPQSQNSVDKVDGEIGVLILGLGGLLMVPFFKSWTHLPPYMGILLALGIVWASTEWIHRKKGLDKNLYTPSHALAKIDTPSILFFLGILLAVSALETASVLSNFSGFLDNYLGNKNLIVFLIGLSSAVVDNVPLVAASMAMYSLAEFPMDHNFWIFLAYAAGTGGSILIIGSAAGVAAMGMEKIDFLWYMKKISLLALAGYVAGSLCYLTLA